MLSQEVRARSWVEASSAMKRSSRTSAGFLKFPVQESEPTIEIDFDAIGRY